VFCDTKHILLAIREQCLHYKLFINVIMFVKITDTLPNSEKLVLSSGAKPALGKDGAIAISVLVPRTKPDGKESNEPPLFRLPPLLRLPPPPLPPETVPLISPLVRVSAEASELSVPVTSEALAKDTPPTKTKAKSKAET
jgi:hypothetical protein